MARVAFGGDVTTWVPLMASVEEESATIRVSGRSEPPHGPVRWLPVLAAAILDPSRDGGVAGGGGVVLLEFPLFEEGAFFGAIFFTRMQGRM